MNNPRRHCEEPAGDPLPVIASPAFGGLAMTIILLFGIVSSAEAKTEKIRVGHFPNVTHAPALIARASRHFESRLGSEAEIEWKTFNAGPEAIEALFAGALDILYVGPSPAINGYVRSRGEALRIVAGVASGGAGFVVRANSGIERFEDIRGKRVATPQKGNTQDVALHYLMKEKEIIPKTKGGDVEIFHLSGGDQITVFLKEQVDAIWTVEPWLTRLTVEANGRVLFEDSEFWPEGQYATTVLVVRKKFLDEHPDLVRKWVKGHVEIIEWINGHYSRAKQLFNEEFTREAGKALPPNYLERFFLRLSFDPLVLKSQIRESAERAYQIGYLGAGKPDLTNLFDDSFLETAP